MCSRVHLIRLCIWQMTIYSHYIADLFVIDEVLFGLSCYIWGIWVADFGMSGIELSNKLIVASNSCMLALHQI